MFDGLSLPGAANDLATPALRPKSQIRDHPAQGKQRRRGAVLEFAHLDAVLLEKIVAANHTTAFQNPEAITEMKRILRLYLRKPLSVR